MAFRSHVGRGLDLSIRSNQLLLGLVGLTGLAALALWMSQGETAVLWAPVHAFLVWGVDPRTRPGPRLDGAGRRADRRTLGARRVRCGRCPPGARPSSGGTGRREHHRAETTGVGSRRARSSSGSYLVHCPQAGSPGSGWRWPSTSMTGLRGSTPRRPPLRRFSPLSVHQPSPL